MVDRTPLQQYQLELSLRKKRDQQLAHESGDDRSFFNWLGSAIKRDPISGRPESMDQHINRTLLDPNIKREDRGVLLPFAKNRGGKVEFAMPQAGIDLLKAFGMFGHAAQGGQVRPDEAVLGSMDLAGGGLLSSRFAKDTGKLGIFAGQGAKTADLSKLKQAKKMVSDAKRKGIPEWIGRGKIWRETGWFKGADGKWRFEIDDRGIGLGPGIQKGEITADSARHQLPHPLLHKNYPELEKILTIADWPPPKKSVLVHPKKSARRGSYTPYKTIEVINLRGSDPEDLKSVGLHEYQHAVQNKEGFAKGGSPSAMGRGLLPNRRLVALAEKLATEAQVYDVPPDVFLKTIAPRFNKNTDIRKMADEINKGYSAAPYLASNLDRLAKAKQKLAEADDPFKAYRSLAGEVEARNVQTRMNMTPEERLAKPPWMTEDIPIEDQLIRMEVGSPAEATVWHGSPHRFNKFDMSKIGTGEGAQAYGHGLYFADNPEVARAYQKALAPGRGADVSDTAARVLEGVGGNKKRAIAELQRRKTMKHVQGDADWANKMDEAIASIRSGKAESHLYKVDLPDDSIAKMLDWDKPLSQQPEAIKVLNQAGLIKGDLLQTPTGGVPLSQAGGQRVQAALDSLSRHRPDLMPMKGHEYLKSKGIPGIKYLDQGSRGTITPKAVSPERLKYLKDRILHLQKNQKTVAEAKELAKLDKEYQHAIAPNQTYNYVVFDDQLPTILEMNSMPFESGVQKVLSKKRFK